MYENAKIILATKHKKEEAIRSPFVEAFGATIFVPNDYDTDQFGTFTGEIPRINSAYNTVIEKAKLAAHQYGFDYAIANEGNFGPHPTLFFVPAGIELIAFIDHKNDIVVVESEITTETNYAYHDITAATSDMYADFLAKTQFGTHGLIVRCCHDNKVIAKGVTEFSELDSIIRTSLKSNPAGIRLETDMRAMMNPTRMNVIHRLAHKLVQRLQKKCVQCCSPGFGQISVTGNLLCQYCGTETKLHQFKVLSCVKCDYQELFPRDDRALRADQKDCDYCNP